MSIARLQKLAVAGLLLGALAPQAGAANTTGATMQVSLSVPKACTVTATQAIDFGTQSPTTPTTLQANGLLSLNCRKQNTSVTVQLASVSTSSSSGGTVSGGGNTVAYTLNLPKSTVWSSADLAVCDYSGVLTAWPDAGLQFTSWASTGAKTIAVCSTAAVDGNTAAADYTDTVNVTVTY